MKTRRPLKIIIVEDEFIVAQDIARKLARIGHTVEQHFYNVSEAGRYLHTSPAPDVVIADIYFDRSPEGLVLVEQLKSMGLPHLIISGGEPSDLLRHVKGEDTTRIIHKPIRPRELFVRLENIQEPNTAEQRRSPSMRTLTITRGGKKTLVPQPDIMAIESDNNDFILFTGKQCYISYGSLNALEEVLPDPPFARVHRSYIVNLRQVLSYSARGLHLKNSMNIPVGRKYWPELKHKLAMLEDQEGLN